MAGAIMNKVYDFLGIETEPDDQIVDIDDNLYAYGNDKDTEGYDEPEGRGFFAKRNKVVSMPQQHQVRMVVTQPTSFEQSEEICNYLKERRSVVLNLEYVNKDVARRIVDFVSGSVHALDGQIQKVSNAIFLIVPTNYEVASDLAREEIKSKLSVSWLRDN